MGEESSSIEGRLQKFKIGERLVIGFAATSPKWEVIGRSTSHILAFWGESFLYFLQRLAM
jgi:hypothetical protein